MRYVSFAFVSNFSRLIFQKFDVNLTSTVVGRENALILDAVVTDNETVTMDQMKKVAVSWFLCNFFVELIKSRAVSDKLRVDQWSEPNYRALHDKFESQSVYCQHLSVANIEKSRWTEGKSRYRDFMLRPALTWLIKFCQHWCDTFFY